jgi:hercynylcysteine S-oxide lyase
LLSVSHDQCQINVRLPINASPSSLVADEKTKLVEFFFSTQAFEYKTTVPLFAHRGLWWTRLSAQVYNDLEDFEYVAGVLKSVCERVNAGEHRGERLPSEEEKVALDSEL